MLCSADARICVSGHGPRRASPRRRVAHYHDKDVHEQECYSIEEQARDNRRDRRAVATGESPPAAPGPERVVDTERLAEWHLAAPGDVRAASGKVAFGHRMAADPVPDPAAAGLTIRHRVEGVLVLRAGHISPRVHLGGQEKHGDTSHRDEHDDDEQPAATVARRIAMRVSVQRVMRNAALRAHPDGRVGVVNARCINYYYNEPGQNQSKQHEDRDNAEGFRRSGEVLEQVYVDPRVHREANHAAYRHPGPPAPPVMQSDE